MHIIDQARGQGGWILAKFSFCVFMDRGDFRSIKAEKKNETNIQPPWPRAWSIVCKSNGAFRFSLFSSSVLTEKSQKIFLLSRKIFCERKLLCTCLNFGEMLLREQNGQSRAGSVVSSGSQSQRGIWFTFPARGACRAIKDCNKSRSIRFSRIWVPIYQSFYGLLKFSVDLFVVP